MKKEELIKAIQENIAINRMIHRIGSHSDDYGGESDYPCDCDNEKKKYKIEALEAIKMKLEAIKMKIENL